MCWTCTTKLRKPLKEEVRPSAWLKKFEKNARHSIGVEHRQKAGKHYDKWKVGLRKPESRYWRMKFYHCGSAPRRFADHFWASLHSLRSMNIRKRLLWVVRNSTLRESTCLEFSHRKHIHSWINWMVHAICELSEFDWDFGLGFLFNIQYSIMLWSIISEMEAFCFKAKRYYLKISWTNSNIKILLSEYINAWYFDKCWFNLSLFQSSILLK